MVLRLTLTLSSSCLIVVPFDIRNNNLFDYEVIAQPPEELKVSNERLNNDEESDDAENENINDKTEGRDL